MGVLPNYAVDCGRRLSGRTYYYLVESARVDGKPRIVSHQSGLRQLKNVKVVSFGPLRHWTDSKIRVHVFYCVLALAIAHLIRREAERAGLHLSVRELLAELAGIGETVLLHHDGGRGRPRAQRMLTDTTPRQDQLATLFNIHRYAPTR